MSRHRANRLHLALAWAVSIAVHTLLVAALYEAYIELAVAPHSRLALRARDPVLSKLVPEPVRFRSRPGARERRSAASVRRAEAMSSALPRRTAAIDPQLALNRPDSHPQSRQVTRSAALPAAPVELPVAAPRETARVAEDLEFTPVALPLPRKAGTAAPIVSTLLHVAARPSDERRRVAAPPADVLAPSRGPLAKRRRQPAAAFARRVQRLTPEGLAAAVERGLEFLARAQLDDGRWRFDELRGLVAPDAEPVQLRADAAATGLALLAFLGAGYDHIDGRYRWVVEDALRYLMRVQQPDGLLYREERRPAGEVARFYSHGIATLALCEAYGMTGDEELRDPAQRAIDYLVATQHAQRGGWRYVPGVNADLSVTGWQVMGLRTGCAAGLAVPPETFERAAACVEACRDQSGDGALFRYNPWASDNDPLTRHGQRPSTVMTAVGLTTHLLLNPGDDDPRIRFAVEHLRGNLPRTGPPAPVGTLGSPERDTYYWYYATQAMYYTGGAPWREWSAALEPLLVETQVRSGRLAGSWDPMRPVPDKWADYGGRLYVTALNLLSLEIPNRHLPFEAWETPQVAERPHP